MKQREALTQLPNPDDLLSGPQLEAIFGVTRLTVWRWRAKHGLKSVGTYRLRRYRWQDVLDYMEALQVKAGERPAMEKASASV